MRLTGKVTAVPVESINEDGVEETVTFFVSLNWGQLKEIVAEMGKLDDDDPAATLEFVEQQLIGITKRVEGLENAEGEPITGLTLGVLDELMPELVMKLWARITAIGEDLEQGETTVPLSDSSESKPESSPKGSE